MEKTTENDVTNPEANAMLNESPEDNQASSSSSIKECETIDLTFLEQCDSENTSIMLHDPLDVTDQQISVIQTDTMIDHMEMENREDNFQESRK